MKKILILAILTISNMTFAQDKETKNNYPTTKDSFRSKTNLGKNEFKGNVLFLVLDACKISYERILNQESSIGITIGKSFNRANFNYNYAIEPYYRYYFGKKPTACVFLD